MTAQTPKYNLVYPVDADNIRDLPDILKAQAQSIENALAAFDYSGTDPSQVLSKVASLQTITANLQNRMPTAVNYSNGNLYTALSQSTFATIGNLSPVVTDTSMVTYSGGKFTFLYDCVAIINFTAVMKPRISNSAEGRKFIELAYNYTGGNASNGLGRAHFSNEDAAAAFHSGRFAAGDSVTPVAYTDQTGQAVYSANVSMVVQRL